VILAEPPGIDDAFVAETGEHQCFVRLETGDRRPHVSKLLDAGIYSVRLAMADR
jgi:hypothetical protein